MHATWLDTNSWLLEIAQMRVLVDPWLLGPLVFGGQEWLFKGIRPQPRPLPTAIDLILLSQGLEDHAHPETLKQLDKSTPVVASESAAAVAQQLGFSRVTTLVHGQDCQIQNLQIQAVPGAPVGPLRRENGYILKDLAEGLSVFYEPHGYHDSSLQQAAPIDVVITPVMDLALPLVGPIIRGQQGAQELVKWLCPQWVLPTAGAGEVEYQGLIVSMLRAAGGPQQLQQELRQQGLRTQVLSPQVGERLELSTEAAEATPA